jgi:hypothetical protein
MGSLLLHGVVDEGGVSFEIPVLKGLLIKGTRSITSCVLEAIVEEQYFVLNIFDIDFKEDGELHDEIENVSEEEVLLPLNEDDEFLQEGALNIESANLVLDEKSVKTYWTDDTEAGIIDFLYLNEFFYENRIKEENEEAEKEKRPINKAYCYEMEKRREEVLKIEDREYLREKIFREKIETPLRKLVENILFNYRLFLPDTDAKTQQKDCFTFLYLKFANFNPWRKTKSFSYFGTIAKHYFLGNKKEFSKNVKILNDYDSNKEEADSKILEDPKPYIKEDASLDLFNFIINSIEQELNKNSLSKNDQKVGDAIVQIFKNHEIIGVYNKNQVYQLIKENTGLETKDITYSLRRFRIVYKVLKQEFVQKREE